MIIVAGGDSFVYGSELADCQDNPRIKIYGHSLSTYSALLSQEHSYECLAWPGYGNDSIARNVITRCEQSPVDLVLVSWTFPCRYEFRFNYDTRHRKSPWHTITPWTIETVENIQKEYINNDDSVLFIQERTTDLAKKTGIADFAEVFYRNVGNSEYWEVYSSLKEIVYLQNYLKSKNIPYLFSCADNSILYNQTVETDDETIQSLYQQVLNDQHNWFWFPPGINPQDTCKPRGFYQWAVENKYKIGTTHPLEEAHLDASKLMQEKFNELVKKSVQ